MSSLGQWFFEKEKQSILRAVERRAPYVAKVSAVAGGNKVRIIDPFTQAVEDEILTVVGPLPLAGQNVMVMPLRDGERVVFRIPDPLYDETYTNSIAIGAGANPTWWDAVAIGEGTEAYDRAVAIGDAAKATTAYSIAVGNTAEVTNQLGIAIGYAAKVAGDSAVAIGTNAVADKNESIAIGRDAVPPLAATAHIATARLYVNRGSGSSALVLQSPDGSRWMISVGNTGVVNTTKL